MLPCLAVFLGLTAWYEQAETGFRTSAGISCSKMLAKLVSGMHKPDDQTVILPCHAAAFVATLPVRAIPGEHHILHGAYFLQLSWQVTQYVVLSEACWPEARLLGSLTSARIQAASPQDLLSHVCLSG